jgi:hypothetical protein
LECFYSYIGYFVVAITGKESEQDYLTNLGAKEISAQRFENLKRPITKPLFAGTHRYSWRCDLRKYKSNPKAVGAITCWLEMLHHKT